MGERRVRTPAGVMRFDKPVGSVIARRITTNRAESIAAPLRKEAPRRRYQRITAGVKGVNATYQKIEAGERLTGRERERAEYLSPSARRRALAERGTVVRPKRESLNIERSGSRSGRVRRVAANPSTGKYVIAGGGRGRQAPAASAGRKAAATRKRRGK